MTALCPTCGGPLRRCEIVVDLNVNTLSVPWAASGVRLTAREAELLSVLVDRSPAVLSTERLIRLVWGDNEGVAARKNLGVLIWRLRRKLEFVGLRIENVWDCGWRLVKVERALSEAAE